MLTHTSKPYLPNHRFLERYKHHSQGLGTSDRQGSVTVIRVDGAGVIHDVTPGGGGGFNGPAAGGLNPDLAAAAAADAKASRYRCGPLSLDLPGGKKGSGSDRSTLYSTTAAGAAGSNRRRHRQAGCFGMLGGGGAAGGVDGSGGGMQGPEARYLKEYEARLNPFAEFQVGRVLGCGSAGGLGKRLLRALCKCGLVVRFHLSCQEGAVLRVVVEIGHAYTLSTDALASRQQPSAPSANWCCLFLSLSPTTFTDTLNHPPNQPTAHKQASESEARLRGMRLHDKALLAGSRLIAGSKLARAGIALYVLLLHAVIMALMYFSATPHAALYESSGSAGVPSAVAAAAAGSNSSLLAGAAVQGLQRVAAARAAVDAAAGGDGAAGGMRLLLRAWRWQQQPVLPHL